MFTLKSLTIIFTSQNKDVPTEFLIKAVEVTERLDDENQENREEAVRCLGALLHFITEKMKQVADNINQNAYIVYVISRLRIKTKLNLWLTLLKRYWRGLFFTWMMNQKFSETLSSGASSLYQLL